MNRKILNKLEQQSALIDEIAQISLTDKFSDKKGQRIDWDDLINTLFEEWNVLEGYGVRFKRVKHPEHECYFITELDPLYSDTDLAEFGLQWHNCKEIGEVIDGELIEGTEHDKIYEKGDYFIFPINHKHLPYSKTRTTLGVYFINPNK